jgi:hypothetical protein
MPEALFNVLVGMAFISSIADHWFVGRGVIHRPNRALLLGLFIATESAVALDGKPAMWLYVTLNFWGLYSLFLHQKVALGTIWLKRRARWFHRRKR